MATSLYRRGRVRSADGHEVTALVVADDRLAWLGDEAGADRHADAVDAVVDLDGALVLPAFVDAHAHLSHTGMGLRGVDLGGTTSVSQALRAVEDAVRRSGGRPVFALNWQEHDWVEDRALTSAELDRAAFGGVVYASRIDGHSAVVSSALAAACGAAGLDGWMGDGLVTRDAKNAARAAFDAARSPAQRRDDIAEALRSAAARGIALVHECGGPLLTSADDFAEVLELGRRPDLPRTLGYWAEAVSDPEQARALVALHGATGLGGDLNIDGSIGSFTAHLREPYADDPTCRGTAYRSSAQVRDHVAACALAGIQSGFHVIGDAGMDTVLDGYEAAAALVGLDVVRASRPRLEHAELVDAAGVSRMARLGIVASVQPAFDAFWGGPGGMYETRLGDRRARSANPWRLHALSRRPPRAGLGLPGHAVRPVGDRPGRGGAPRPLPAPRRRHGPRRTHGGRLGGGSRGRRWPARHGHGGHLLGLGRSGSARRRPAGGGPRRRPAHVPAHRPRRDHVVPCLSTGTARRSCRHGP